MPPAPSDPEGVDLLLAVRRHALIFIVPVLLGVGIMAAYALSRDEQYTAEARLSVGRLDVQTQGLPGFTQAGVLLGAAFARAVDAPAITQPAARRAGVTQQEAADALSASQIPSSPLIRVEAETGDKAESIKLANSAATAMVAYSHKLGSVGGDAPQLLDRFTALSRDEARLTLKRDQLAEAYRRKPSDARRVALQAATGKLQAVKLERNAVGNVYGAQQATGSTASLLGVVVPATSASSDRNDELWKYIVTGGIAGIVVGLALAAWREAGYRRRRSAELRPAA
jgi:hypothetical protein